MGELPTGGAQGFLRIGINYNRDHPAKLVGEFDGLVDELTIWNEATTDTYEPPPLGDVNLDGILSGDGTGPPEEDDVSAFIAGWMTVSIEDDTITRWMKGDLNLSGASELDDVVLFQQGLISAGLTFPGFGPFVPEPSTAWLLAVGAMLLAARRQGIASP
jgi:hypothetical protein